MAEVLVIGGVSITLATVLKGAAYALKSAYDIYGDVAMRRKQISIYLSHYRDLLEVVTKERDDHTDDRYKSRKFSRAPRREFEEAIDYFQNACEYVYDVVQKLGKKNFLWCLANNDKITLRFLEIQTRLEQSYRIFNIKAISASFELQETLGKAREEDQQALILRLDAISAKDDVILSTIRGGDERIEELLISIRRCVEKLAESDRSPQAQFIRSAQTVVERVSRGHTSVNKVSVDMVQSAEYVITKIEVDFNDKDNIGEGGFGKVFKGFWKGTRVAIKQMHFQDSQILSKEDRESLFKEVKLWSTLRHPNILDFYGACVEGIVPFLVMEYCEFGNVMNYLQAVDKPNRIDLAYDLVSGIHYLHDKNIVHGDLKGYNVIVNDRHVATVADFGLSTVVNDIRTRSRTSRKRDGGAGTPQWMAPEVLDGARSTKQSDIYSMALTIWEIFAEKIPFEGLADTRILGRVVVDQKKRPDRPDNMENDAIWRLITDCWRDSPLMRPSAEKVQARLGPHSTRLHYKNINHIYVRPMETFYSLPSAVTAETLLGDNEDDNLTGFKQQWKKSIQTAEPRWTRGSPPNYIDLLTIPSIPSEKQYQYRVVKGDANLGVRPTYTRETNGSQRINLLEYNEGYGISDRTRIRVYAIDPDHQEEMMVAEWPGR